MAMDDSGLDAVAIGRVRALLRKPQRPERMWPVLAAAAALAISALAFATAMILAPPVVTYSAVRAAPNSS